jgi:hypothetical protein
MSTASKGRRHDVNMLPSPQNRDIDNAEASGILS